MTTASQSRNPIFAATSIRRRDDAAAVRRGAVGRVRRSWACGLTIYAHLVGSEGSILDNKFHSQKLAGLNRHAWSELSMKMLDSGDVSDHPYQTQFQAFFDALDADKDMPLTSFADAFATHRIIAAADKSAAEKRAVKVSEIPIA